MQTLHFNGLEDQNRQILEKKRRSAFIPITDNVDGKPTDSKFGGTPYLLGGEDWPCCTHCGLPLQLFLQLNVANLPDLVQQAMNLLSGVIQLFYCDDDDCVNECESFEPYSICHFVRLVRDVSQATNKPTSRPSDPYPVERIIEWEEVEDYPSPDELVEEGLVVNEELEEFLVTSQKPELGDKLWGWPFWIQEVSYPSCKECAQPMRLLFQFDSEDHLPVMFGDSGVAHLTQCPVHPHVLAFGWDSS